MDGYKHPGPGRFPSRSADTDAFFPLNPSSSPIAPSFRPSPLHHNLPTPKKNKSHPSPKHNHALLQKTHA